jgi:hypothetical protein
MCSHCKNSTASLEARCHRLAQANLISVLGKEESLSNAIARPQRIRNGAPLSGVRLEACEVIGEVLGVAL